MRPASARWTVVDMKNDWKIIYPETLTEPALSDETRLGCDGV